jgi:hypothetical protein
MAGSTESGTKYAKREWMTATAPPLSVNGAAGGALDHPAPERLTEDKRSGYRLLHKPINPDDLRRTLAKCL